MLFTAGFFFFYISNIFVYFIVYLLILFVIFSLLRRNIIFHEEFFEVKRPFSAIFKQRNFKYESITKTQIVGGTYSGGSNAIRIYIKGDFPLEHAFLDNQDEMKLLNLFLAKGIKINSRSNNIHTNKLIHTLKMKLKEDRNNNKQEW